MSVLRHAWHDKATSAHHPLPLCTNTVPRYQFKDELFAFGRKTGDTRKPGSGWLHPERTKVPADSCSGAPDDAQCGCKFCTMIQERKARTAHKAPVVDDEVPAAPDTDAPAAPSLPHAQVAPTQKPRAEATAVEQSAPAPAGGPRDASSPGKPKRASKIALAIMRDVGARNHADTAAAPAGHSQPVPGAPAQPSDETLRTVEQHLRAERYDSGCARPYTSHRQAPEDTSPQLVARVTGITTNWVPCWTRALQRPSWRSASTKRPRRRGRHGRSLWRRRSGVWQP